MLNYFILYQFIKKMTTPFDKWDAFKNGVIDKSGNIVIKKIDRNREQLASLSVFDVLIRNLKRFISKLPGGVTQLSTFATAMYLLKEHHFFDEEKMLNEDIESNHEIDFDKLGQYVVEMVTASVVMSGGWMSKEAQKRWTEKDDKNIFSRFQ